MAKRRLLSVLAGSATAAAVLGGLPAAAGAATAATVPAGLPGALAFLPLTAGQAARLSRGAGQPVIVILKQQSGLAAAGGLVPPVTSAAAAAQSALITELSRVRAAAITRFTLVNAVSATVSAAEERRLATDPAVARVIPDQAFTVPAPVSPAPASPAPASPAPVSTTRLAAGGGRPRPAAGGPARTTSLPPHRIPGACAPGNKTQLAPEGLALTSTASGDPGAPTARSLGFTGAGVKVGYIADGLDPRNVNFRRGNGTSVFAGYKDFTGNGPDSPTAGGEAFLDASTIAGQGVHAYHVNGYSAQSNAGTACGITIQGVAPGASLVGLDVFSGDRADQLATTTSMFAQAINYATLTARVNVLNESFGGNTLPDSARDVIKAFDDAAVRAGVVVSVSTGDAGPANTIGSPATDPNVISVGASTQFQALAQANIGGARYFATRGWLSGNISSFSSSGFDEAGRTVDLVAPGDLSWASCDADTARYSECVNDRGQPSDIEQAGGTSESAPFVAGAAALVIQAFRQAHGGQAPSPAQVKQVLLSTATDLGAPAQEQGAGLLDSYQAVRLAQSYGGARRTGATLLTSPGQLTYAGPPGSAKKWQVTVTNEGARAQAVGLSARTLSRATTTFASGAVTLSDSASSRYTADTGRPVNYATFRFLVPAGRGRLDVSLAYKANPGVVTRPPNLALFDPEGRVAADSEPQGVGNYGNVGVRAPAAGEWTAVVSGYPASAGGYNGKVVWQEATQDFAAFGSVSPASLWLAPGQAKSFTFAVTAPASPGDLAGSVLLHAGGRVASVPVVVRSLVDVAAGGRFAGDLTGGNGRGALGTGDYYQFTVPSGAKAVRAGLRLGGGESSGSRVGAYLVGPDGNVLGYGQNADLPQERRGGTGLALTATALHPPAGTWTLIVAFAEPVAGTAVSAPYTGSVALAAAGTAAPARPLPDGTALTPGAAVTIPVTVTNTGAAPQDYYLDPRLGTSGPVRLAPFVFGASAPFTAGSARSRLPLSASAATSLYFVPSETSAVTVRQASSVPAMTDLSTATGGDPDIGPAGLTTGSLCARSVSETYAPAGAAVTSGAWAPAPTECGPYRAAAPAATATDTVTVTTAGFDRTVTAATGDFEQLALSPAAGGAGVQKAVEVQPGHSATVNVTFKAAGAPGSRVSGTLYLDALQSDVPAYGQLAGDEVAALPYSYVVG